MQHIELFEIIEISAKRLKKSRQWTMGASA